MIIPWLEPLTERWRTQLESGRAPHAVMLIGAAGTGKRCAAEWLAERALCTHADHDGPRYPREQKPHPDLHRVSPLPDRQTIGVDQVRELVGELNLTSHDGVGKVAIIDPANAMTANAANSLLKTLEEPPGAALIVLVADRSGWLPATIFSRCQHIAVRLPGEQGALAWLDRLRPGANWAAALRESGGAPLAAVAALEHLEEHAAMTRDFAAVAGRTASPIEVAARWARQEPQRVLDWLCRQVQLAIRRRATGRGDSTGATLPDSVLQHIDSRNLFCYLDIINRLRGQAAGSFNVQLTFESLLIDWAGSLSSYNGGAGEASGLLDLDAR